MNLNYPDFFDFICRSPRDAGSKHNGKVRKQIKKFLKDEKISFESSPHRMKVWSVEKAPSVKIIFPFEKKLEALFVKRSVSIQGIARGKIKPAKEILTYETYLWQRLGVYDENDKILFYLIGSEGAYWPQCLDSKREKTPYLMLAGDFFQEVKAGMSENPEMILEASFESKSRQATIENIVILPSENFNGVVFLAHLDSFYNSPGANDNGSGIYILFKLIQNLQGHGFGFIFSDGEEYGKNGTELLIWKMKKEGTLSKIKKIVNIDSAGAGDHLYLCLDAKTLQEFEQNPPLSYQPSFPVHLYPHEDARQYDSWNFLKWGISSVQIGAGSSFSREKKSFYHTPEDTLKNLDKNILEEAFRLALSLGKYFSRKQ